MFPCMVLKSQKKEIKRISWFKKNFNNQFLFFVSILPFLNHSITLITSHWGGLFGKWKNSAISHFRHNMWLFAILQHCKHDFNAAYEPLIFEIDYRFFDLSMTSIHDFFIIFLLTENISKTKIKIYKNNISILEKMTTSHWVYRMVLLVLK